MDIGEILEGSKALYEPCLFLINFEPICGHSVSIHTSKILALVL